MTAAAAPTYPERERTKPSRGPLIRLAIVGVVVFVVLVVLVYAARFLGYAWAHETTDDATVDADQVQLTSKISERVDAIYLNTNQYVRKGQLVVQLDDADERDRYNSALAAVDAQRAQTAAAQSNVTYTRDAQVAQNQQNAGKIAQARAGVRSATQNARSSLKQIDAAAAAVDTANAALRSARDAVPGALEQMRRSDADLRRTQSLVSTGDLAITRLDAARATYEQSRSQYAETLANVSQARASVDQAQQRLDAQRYVAASDEAQIGAQEAAVTTAQGNLAESNTPSRIGVQQAQANAQQAQIGTLRSQLQTAANNLGYTRIVSPIDAFVGQKNVEVGQTVGAGQALITLIPANGIYITANYKETQVGHMRVGDEVDINVDAYSGHPFVGHVENLSPASENAFSLVPAQNATGNFVKITQRVPVRILFDHPDPRYPLRPGLSVETSVLVR